MEFISVLLGGTLVAAVFAFLQFLIARSDKKDEEKKEILEAIDKLDKKLIEVDEKIDTNKADGCRDAILTFDDELRRGLQHSQESFNQIFEKCNYYENFCRHHPKYENNKATAAIENIKHVYQIVKEENRFI